MDITPIRRADSFPVIPYDLQQVMSPNLDAGMASGSTQVPAEQEVDQAIAILQSWSEARANTVQLCEHTPSVHNRGQPIRALSKTLMQP